MRKRLLSPLILLLLTVTLLSGPIGVYSVESPYIMVYPSSIVDDTLTPGENFTVSIYTDYTGADVTGYQFTLNYNASILNGISVTNGDLISGGTAQLMPGTFDNEAGELSLTAGFFFAIGEPVPITSGPGTLANVTFTVVGVGTSDITIGPETKLIGYTEGGYGDEYYIIDATIMFDHIQHGYFDNTVPPPPPVPPVAVITAPEIAYVNEIVGFSGAESYDPDGGVIMSYRWDFGDGTPPVETSSLTITHTYTELGIYLATLVVTDEENEESPPAEHSIEVIAGPVADLVKWKVKPEAYHWVWSRDEDKLVTLTALARNLGEIPAFVKVTFAIVEARYGSPAGPDKVVTTTLAVSPQDVPITVKLDPYQYDYDGTTKKVLYAHVTLSYYDPATETLIPTKTKIVRFAVVP